MQKAWWVPEDDEREDQRFHQAEKKPAAVLTEATRKLPPFSVSLFLTLN